MAELNSSKDSDNIDDLMAKYDTQANGASSETDDELAALKAKLGLQ